MRRQASDALAYRPGCKRATIKCRAPLPPPPLRHRRCTDGRSDEGTGHFEDATAFLDESCPFVKNLRRLGTSGKFRKIARCFSRARSLDSRQLSERALRRGQGSVTVGHITTPELVHTIRPWMLGLSGECATTWSSTSDATRLRVVDRANTLG